MLFVVVIESHTGKADTGGDKRQKAVNGITCTQPQGTLQVVTDIEAVKSTGTLVSVSLGATGGRIAKVGLTTYHPIVLELIKVAKLETGVDIGGVEILVVSTRG